MALSGARPLGVILAGGAARRMGGGDKGLLALGAGTMIGAVIARLAPQAGALAISANGEPARLAHLGLPILRDADPSRPGPLAGVLAGLDWAAGRGAGWIVTAPADAPFLPEDLAARLIAAGGGRAAVASAGGWRHPTFGLWPVAAREALRGALAGGTRRVDDWARAQGAGEARFEDEGAFLNVNTPEDLARARARVGA